MKKINKLSIGILLSLLLIIGVVSAAPSYTYLSDSVSWFKDSVGIGTDTPSEMLDVVGNVVVSGTIDAATINTGQGDFEIYGMGQYLQPSSSVEHQSLLLDQNTNAVALNIDSEATTQNVFTLSKLSTSTGTGMHLSNSDGLNSLQFLRNDLSGDGTNYISRNLAPAATGGPLLKLYEANAADDQPTIYALDNGVGNTLRLNKDGTAGNVVNIENAGTGYASYYNQDGNQKAVYIDSESTTNGVVQILSQITGGAGGGIDKHAVGVSLENAGGGFYAYTNYGSTDANSFLMHLRQDNAANNKVLAKFENDGTGMSSYYDSNGNSKAIFIDSEATTQDVVEINAAALTTGSALYAHDTSTAWVGSTGLVEFTIDNPSSTGSTLYVRNDGSGHAVKLATGGTDLGIDFNGKDVDDIGTLGLQDRTELTISGGAITMSQSFHGVDTEADAASDYLAFMYGGSNGDIVTLRAENDARSIIVQDATSGSGTFRIAGDFTMDTSEDTITVIRDGGVWKELSRSDNR